MPITISMGFTATWRNCFAAFGDFDGAFGAGKSMVNRIHTMAIQSGNGGAQECWADAPITGEEFLYALVLRISNGKAFDGVTDDWPIGYEDIKPYYDKIDRLLGVFGTNEGLENDPDGIFLPPPKPRLH